MENLNLPTVADITAFGLLPSNSSREPTAPVITVKFDKDATDYDMSGDKFLIILNQHKFEKPKWFSFKRRASTRYGTYSDEGRLREIFHNLNFLTFVFRDMKYESIIKYLTAFASLDHTRTSCVCVTILTHGANGGKILAADQPYQLSEIMHIFAKPEGLINKPKMYFVQACRGGNMDAGHTVKIATACDSQLLTMPAYNFSMSIYEQRQCLPFSSYATYEEVIKRMAQLRQDDTPSRTSGSIMNFFKICTGFWKHSNNTDRLDNSNKSILTVPTHADTVVVCSTVEDFLSYRDGSGSWMIQALCDAIENRHQNEHILDMITRMNRNVAYDKITVRCAMKEMNNKKQMPETRFTLTKLLKL